jgi:hypothetical protein
MRQVFFCIRPRKTLTFGGHFFHGGRKSEQLVAMLLTFNADGSNKLAHFVNGKYESQHFFKNVRGVRHTCKI